VPGPQAARAAADRVDRLLAQLRGGPDPGAARVAEDLVRCLVQLYGTALERIVEIGGPRLSEELCADPLVESLMLVHDLHPLGPDARVRRALDRVRRYAGELRTRAWPGFACPGPARAANRRCVKRSNRRSGTRRRS
jgi:hypothetical protein